MVYGPYFYIWVLLLSLKKGTPHSRYFSDELGVPNFLINTEHMFAISGNIWYNINIEKDIFTIKENTLSYGRGYVYSLGQLTRQKIK